MWIANHENKTHYFMVQIELYFGGVDTNSSGVLYNPRIELEALHSILSVIDKTLSSGNHALTSILQDLRDVCIDMIKELGGKIRLETRIVTDFRCDNERCLLQWGERSGVQRKLEVACKFFLCCYFPYQSSRWNMRLAKFNFFL